MNNNLKDKEFVPYTVVIELDKVIVSLRNNFRMLDGELKKSKQDLDHIHLEHQKASNSTEKNKLIEKENKIRKTISLKKIKIKEVEERVRKEEKTLNQLKTNLADFETRKNILVKNINNRSIFKNCIKYVLGGDLECQEIKRIENDLYKNSLKKKSSLKLKKRYIHEQKQLEKKLTLLVNEFNAVVSEIKRLDNYKRELVEKLKITEGRYSSKKEKIEVKKQKIRLEFEEKWRVLLKEHDEKFYKGVLRLQPYLNKLTVKNINTGAHFPNYLVFGRLCFSYQNLCGYVPRLLPFPLEKSLWLSDENIDKSLIHQLLLRLIHCIPVGTVEITAVDPLRLGKSLGPFLSLLQVKRLFPDRRSLTYSDEIENALVQLTGYVEDLFQHKFKGEIKSWSAYNSADNCDPLSYKLLLVFGVPEQLTDKSILHLGLLLEHGPSCGVLPVLTINEEHLGERKYSKLRTAVEKYCKKMDSVVPVEVLTKYVSEINVVEEQEFWPAQSELEDLLTSISDRYEQNSKFNKSLSDLLGNFCGWGNDAIQGVQAPIGWTADGEIVPFSIGGVNTEHHVLLAGRSGSGKSNLLHVLIHSLCHAYSFSELNIYLLDYKQGTEFSVYVSPPLPQVKLVAVESDPEYGVTVLAHLTKELEKRAREFKARSVRDFYEYRESSEAELPRILLIIDEFQILFSEGLEVAGSVDKMLNQLLRQGRSYGIHVLLATQTLKGIQTLSIGHLISQIGCRIALACSVEDSAMILGDSNREASKLKSPPEGILNNSNGAKSADQRFLIPLADREICRAHILEIRKMATRLGYCGSTKVFNGSQLPEMPVSDWFESRNNEVVELHLGETLSFEAEPLSVALVNRPSFNLLISGYSDAIHDGLLASVLQSLEFQDGIDEILYFNGRSIIPKGACKYLEGGRNTPVLRYDSVASLNLFGIFDELQKSKRILIIDGLDSTKEFYSGLRRDHQSVKKDGPLSPHESIKKILEDGPLQGTFVIAFADNWRRCNTSCRDLMSFFEMRVGFCMNEEDANSFISGAIGKKFKGLETDNRAVFINRLENQVSWFRPYI